MKVEYHRRYVEKDGIELKLTTKEYDLLEFLIRNRNLPFTREQLLEKVWGYDYIGDIRVIDDLVKRLRKKLDEAGALLDIKTVWGYGYRIDD
jgi:DNA-binding response OmpR family regulator